MFAGKTLFFASPLHDGRVESAYFCAAIDLDRGMRAHNIPVQFYFHSGESLITRARNNICKVFLESRCGETGEPWTHLVMMDSDMQFTSDQIARVLGMADAKHQVIAGLAPVKAINWEAVRKDAVAGFTAKDLESAGSRMVVNPLPGHDYSRNDDALVPVKYCGTGFILIAREALLAFQNAYPELAYLPDYKIGEPALDDAEDPTVTAFFDTMICPDEKRYLSEDFYFCNKMKAIGIQPYVCRDVLVGHIGKYTYKPRYCL